MKHNLPHNWQSVQSQGVLRREHSHIYLALCFWIWYIMTMTWMTENLHRHILYSKFVFLFFFLTRTYRGFNLCSNVADVTLENNLSRVVTAVSHAFTSSTSRALTVRLQRCINIIKSTQLFLHLTSVRQICVFSWLHVYDSCSLDAVKPCASWL